MSDKIPLLNNPPYAMSSWRIARAGASMTIVGDVPGVGTRRLANVVRVIGTSPNPSAYTRSGELVTLYANAAALAEGEG